jgi:hypothetical protein
MVPEEYTEHVPVEKTRRVPKLVTQLRETEDVKVIQVPTNRVIEEDAVRLETVMGHKQVEIEEEHDYELRPVGTRVLGQRY